MRHISLILAITLLATTAQADMTDKQFAWVERGKDAVRSTLKDGESARFRNVFFNRGQDDIPMACGEVNAKNSLGGYSGYQHFISAGRPDLTFLENQVSDFRTIWDRFCK